MSEEAFERLIEDELVETRDSKTRIYLDHAGATIAPKSLISAAFADLLSFQSHGNPHSHSAYEEVLGQARAVVLSHFHASPEVYDVIFTSGATQSLKLVAETFNYGPNGRFYHPINVHTSVLGMRAFAPSSHSFPSNVLYQDRQSNHDPSTSRDDSITCHAQVKFNLLAVAGECNFSGAKCSLLSAALWAGELDAYWLLDAAKLAATSPVHLDDLPVHLQPHFFAASFYKMFGYPTGLGLLLVKKECRVVLKKKYYGGGSIAAAAADSNWVSFRTSLQDSLTDGTSHYQGIMAIKRGMEALLRLGGMAEIQRRTGMLTRELAVKLAGLRHGQSGLPLCTIYGKHLIEDEGDDDFHEYISRQGPTVTFTLCWQDGSPVGHTEVGALAVAESIIVRTGCFCNPGGCQESLNQSSDDMKANLLLGRTCAGTDGQGDIINGRQTGAVRVSLGWSSTRSHCDRFVAFLMKHFLDRQPAAPIAHSNIKLDATNDTSSSSCEAYLQEIFVYPIKGCAGVKVNRWPLGPAGLLLDREWAIVDAAGRAMTQKHYPSLALLKPSFSLSEGLMTLRAPASHGVALLEINLDGDPTLRTLLKAAAVDAADCDNERSDTDNELPTGGASITFPTSNRVSGTAPFRHVHVCGQQRSAQQTDTEHVASDWLTRVVGEPCFLMRRASIPADCAKGTQKSGKDNGTLVDSFANEAQFLLVNAASVQLHSQQMQESAQFSANFRPNFVIHGAPAYSEDSWKSLRLIKDGLIFQVTGQCQRCSVINVNGSTGVVDGRALASLANYRRKLGSSAINFGLFLKMSCEPQGEDNRVIFIYRNCQIQVDV